MRVLLARVVVNAQLAANAQLAVGFCNMPPLSRYYTLHVVMRKMRKMREMLQKCW